MKKSTVLMEVAGLLVLTILLAYDFFPALNNVFYIPKGILLLLLATVLLLGLFSGRKQVRNAKESLVRHVVTLVYLLLIITVFTLMGGTSQVGISMESPTLWIIVAISLIQIQRQWRKAATVDRRS